MPSDSREFGGRPNISHVNALSTQLGSDFGVIVLNEALSGR